MPENHEGTGSVDLGSGVWWVGRQTPAELQCHAYLVVDSGEAVLIDPGSMGDFPVVFRKVLDLVAPHQIKAVIAAHQDPDVVGSLPVVEKVLQAPDLLVVAHPETARLLHHVGLQSRVVSTRDLGRRLRVGARELRFLDAPFLHSPGAVVTHDPHSATAFTGDVFGAVHTAAHLFPPDDLGDGFVDALGPWHETYMASQAALSHLLDRLAPLQLAQICPQHGYILRGPQIHHATRYLRTLSCGLDRLGLS